MEIDEFLMHAGYFLLGVFALYMLALLVMALRERRQARPYLRQLSIRRAAYHQTLRSLYQKQSNPNSRAIIKNWVVDIGKGEKAWQAIGVDLSEEAFRAKHGADIVAEAEAKIAAEGPPVSFDGGKLADLWPPMEPLQEATYF